MAKKAQKVIFGPFLTFRFFQQNLHFFDWVQILKIFEFFFRLKLSYIVTIFVGSSAWCSDTHSRNARKIWRRRGEVNFNYVFMNNEYLSIENCLLSGRSDEYLSIENCLLSGRSDLFPRTLRGGYDFFSTCTKVWPPPIPVVNI